MTRELLKSKIHRAWVTEANLNYMGSLTLGHRLCEAADIVPHELVHITNIYSGAHWVTYVIRDDAHAGTVCLNGTSARHFQVGDPVIIMAYGQYTELERQHHHPRLVYVDSDNQISQILVGENPFTPETQ